MNKFKRHKLEWFTNRVGELIQREFCTGSKRNAVSPMMPERFMIVSESHAKALHAFHIDNRINFLEAVTHEQKV